MKPQPFLLLFVSPRARAALGLTAALAAVLQYSVHAYIPGSLDPGALTFENFSALIKPLYARVFLNTVVICAVTAGITLFVGYPIAYALVHARSALRKSAILI